MMPHLPLPLSGFFMIIKGQNWIENDKYIYLKLEKPYFGAWVRYAWDHGTPGFSISKEAVYCAQKLHKLIHLQVADYGEYEINPTKALLNGGKFMIGNVELLCVPKTAFKKLSEIQNTTPAEPIFPTNLPVK